jgi:hypothetical protein
VLPLWETAHSSYASLGRKFICSPMTLAGNAVFDRYARQGLTNAWSLPTKQGDFGRFGTILTDSLLKLQWI